MSDPILTMKHLNALICRELGFTSSPRNSDRSSKDSLTNQHLGLHCFLRVNKMVQNAVFKLRVRFETNKMFL